MTGLLAFFGVSIALSEGGSGSGACRRAESQTNPITPHGRHLHLHILDFFSLAFKGSADTSGIG